MKRHAAQSQANKPVSEKSEWQKGLEEALEDVQAGRVSRVMSEEEFLDHLKNAGKDKQKSRQ